MTLTQAATLTKRTIIAFLILGILGIAGAVGLNFYRQYQALHAPPPPEVHWEEWGQLPLPVFPPSTVTSSNFSYSLDTTTGSLPQTPQDIPKSLRVYFIAQTGINLRAPDKARELAENFGFPEGPKILSEETREFGDKKGGTLTINLITGNFNFEKIATPAAELKNIPDKSTLVEALKKYLAEKNLLPEALLNGEGKTSTDNPMQVSLFPADIDRLSVVTPSETEGLVHALYSRKDETFSKLTYTFWTVDQTSFATYPLKTAEEAYSDLVSGKGYISIIPDKPAVSISMVYLAYFEPEDYASYLQPVFIFEGPNFKALVPAVKSAR
ncbi:hypothetical protein A2617_03405 [Candidatus Daviesbacteria bacterium RIFOXYD1_FULL_41_10]|uniref:Uncharacterized protein n=1 Tax=Candidatus Daviesbacteria bacterium RIFOXYD1_FULL_41_10 TaxID=1797801 RepID=A0A1F5MZA1_9BACT|nr:MAG: hypothetical protein A2617_03405 [Candidatus Daviesbacteria bacterium RIFOXYD1_FULL_41_10]